MQWIKCDPSTYNRADMSGAWNIYEDRQAVVQVQSGNTELYYAFPPNTF